jgi:hypothetical protein
MPTFLSDPTQGFYLALIAFAVITGAIAAKRQDKKSCIPFGVTLLLLLAVYLCDKSVESPREEAVRRATAMANAANDRNPDAFAEHIAETFEYTGEQNTVKKTRSEIRGSSLWSLLRQYNARVSAWGFDRADVNVIDESAVEIGFMAKGEAEGKPVMFYLRATFKKQADGQMRLTALKSFHPANHTERVSIPGF